MPRSFGMDVRPTSTRWVDIARGPTRAEVAAHLAKIHHFATHPEFGPARNSR